MFQFFRRAKECSQSEWFYRIQFAKQIEYVKTIFSQSEKCLIAMQKKFLFLKIEI